MAAYLRSGGGVKRSARPDGYCLTAVLLADRSLSRLQATWTEVGKILRVNEKSRFQFRLAPSGATLVRAIARATRFVPRWIMKKKAGGGSEPKPETAAACQGAGKRRTTPPDQAEGFQFPPDPPPLSWPPRHLRSGLNADRQPQTRRCWVRPQPCFCFVFVIIMFRRCHLDNIRKGFARCPHGRGQSLRGRWRERGPQPPSRLQQRAAVVACR